ncbi:MAG: UDP-N-acetylmuramoyl-L-alanyl-D-glutamate--2,6-diaminopimelate ligase [Gallionella sp.]
MNASLSIQQQIEALNTPVLRLVTDSRKVQPGDIFIAYPGRQFDGRAHIPQAIAQGANAVIWESADFKWQPHWNIANLSIADLQQKSGDLADCVYHAPSDKLWMIGITGTNGKTSCCHWITEGLNQAATPCAMIGTLGNGFLNRLQTTRNTTPDAVCVHTLLAEYLHSGARAVAMEVSSHALSQGRINGVRFDVALFTNLSRDHLDYHGDMASYGAAKRSLFDSHTLKFAVINCDDRVGAEFALQLLDKKVEIIAYGMTEAALHFAERQGLRMVYGSLLEMNTQGLRMKIYSSWGGAEVRSALLGRFNAANLLATLAVLLISDLSLIEAIQTLSKAQPVTGRMQKISGEKEPAIIVDYAHTPDALQKTLLALREINASKSEPTGGKLICVFGCGGERDQGKRALMGQTAEKNSDYCYITSDNPRSEDPMAIIGDIVTGMTISNHKIIADRATAIETAIGSARSNDTVLIAGKGHEAHQEIKGEKTLFSDAAVSRHALKNWSNTPHQTGGVQR